jgi:hypothetical protein
MGSMNFLSRPWRRRFSMWIYYGIERSNLVIVDLARGKE